MKLSKAKKGKIQKDRKKEKPGLEVAVNEDGSVFFFEDSAHVEKREQRKAKRKQRKAKRVK